MNIYLKVLRQYADFAGRARRREYWTFILIHIVIGMVLGAIDGLISYLLEFPAPILSSLYFLGTLVPSLAALVRRLHDSGRSGWWFLVNFIPGIGGIILIVLLFMESEPGRNNWGPNPKGL